MVGDRIEAAHAGMVCLQDVENCIRLMIELIRVLDQDQVDRFARVIF
jgi:putative aminopeptidase FrvX